MSASTEDPAQGAEHLVVGADPAAALVEILGFLAPEPDAAPAAEGGAADPAAAADGGQQPAAGEGAAAGAADAGAPAAGAGGEPGVQGGAAAEPAAGAAPAAAVEPAADAAPDARGVVDASELNEAWGNISNGFEENQQRHFESTALAAVREEYPRYFTEIQKHPRLLVGQEVPAADGSGKMERLRDAADAESWQSAIKQQLVGMVQERVQQQQEQLRPVFETVHASIDLFRNNIDLIPGTKQFDRELADEFAKMAQAYELRSDGKLVGYSVPVQPLINQLRTSLTARRAAAQPPAAGAGAAAAQPTAQQQRAAEQPRTPTGQFDGPQAGIPSRAGSSGAGEPNPADGLMDAFLRQNGVQI